jgi:hypothetical protein
MRHRTHTPHEFSGGVILTRFGSISTRSSSFSSYSSLSSSFWPPHTCESSGACDGNLRNHAGMKNARPFALCSFRFVWFVRSFVHELRYKGGDDSGSGRLTGSVSLRQEKAREETHSISLSCFVSYLERTKKKKKRKFRRRKPKRFHVSPPSFFVCLWCSLI